ncbi:MAG: SOS response-associated peptidase [Caldilineaceae bacterium]
MCGRFTLSALPEQVATLFELPAEPVLAPRYNIAPTQPVAIVRMKPQNDEPAMREWALTYWGLVPSWSKDPSIGARMINARSETVTEKPAFRAAFKRRRCLVPASGFFEWQKQGKTKQPYYITTPNGAPFAIAGLWEYWEGPNGSALESCTLLTTSANELMKPLHDRMPVIIQPDDYAQWLGNGREEAPRELDELHHLLRPYADDGLVAYPVSTYVSNTRNEGVDCVRPLVDHG